LRCKSKNNKLAKEFWKTQKYRVFSL
jgi:hypothetical protein